MNMNIPASFPNQPVIVINGLSRRFKSKLALDTVSLNDATALVAIFGDGLAYEQFATRVAKPVGTVKAIVSRARRRLRECEELRPVLDALRAA